MYRERWGGRGREGDTEGEVSLLIEKKKGSKTSIDLIVVFKAFPTMLREYDRFILNLSVQL